MKSNNQKLYALAIVAHPDDESFLLAGTSLKFAEEGKTVGVYCATRGEKGADRLNRDLSESEMAQIRSLELQNACNLLKCTCEFSTHGDGSLDNENFDALVNELVEKINQYRPSIILTFGDEGISGHRDHIAIGKATVAACSLAARKPTEIWRASIPDSLIEDFQNHMEKRKVHHLHFIKKQLQGAPDEKLMRVDIKKYKDQKLKAIEAHQSQHHPNVVWPTFLEYEYFEVIKSA